ncbi:MAG: PorT family protein [Bdellovibrionaceae bacterium]|nr:PorT family protein [Pseudobdellovibrionaceae bacterium]
MKKASWTIALLLALGLGVPAYAQDEYIDDDQDAEEELDDSESADSDSMNSGRAVRRDRSTDVEVETSRSGTTTTVRNSDGSETTIRSDTIASEKDRDETKATKAMDDEASADESAAVVPMEPAPVAAEMRGEAPRWWPSNIRVIPTAGASSFTTANEVDFDNFDNGFTAGAFLDFGGNTWVFETGVLALQTESTADAETGSAAFDVDNWGIPLLAKLNFSGHPNSTVFMKAGVMPFQSSGTSDDFEVLGVAGIGAAIPLFRNTALTLEGSYNRLFDDNGPLGTYTGVAFLGGLSFGL